ncbi:MAG: class I SAM-dependent methyltransferase [Actinomycetota bacterium]
MRDDRLEVTGGPGRLAARAGRLLRRRLRKALFRVLPRRALYQRVRTPEFYSRDYYDRKKDPLRESGYGEGLTYREEFNQVADVVRDLFGPIRVLDVGCAKGFQVLALRRAGMDTWGIDISDYAVSEAPAEVEPYLKVEEYRKVHFPDEYFDLVLALEVLEHIPPTDIRKVVKELHRLTSRWVWATIPCYGENPFGPDGCLEGKIQPDRISYYRKHVVDLASLRHLVRDIEGYPIHGHLIAASFDWWTALFTSLGFLRRGDLEGEINHRLVPAAQGTWNCFVFEKVGKGAPLAAAQVRLAEGDFDPGKNGNWSAVISSLPRGTYRLNTELRVQWLNWRKPEDDRLLSIRCLSPQKDKVYGLRLVTYGEARRRKSGRVLPVEMNLACPAEEEVLVEVSMADESRLQPLRMEINPKKTRGPLE